MTIQSMIENYGDAIVGEYNLDELRIDECFLTINNTGYDLLHLLSKYVECIGCPYEATHKIPKNENFTIKVNNKFPKQMLLSTDENGTDEVARIFSEEFGEFGVYKYYIGETDYNFEIIQEPVNIYLPMVTVLLIYTGLFLLIPLVKFIRAKIRNEENVDLSEAKNPIGKERVKSLDTFRGISIVLMIFVNYGHGGYPILEHAPWNGLYVGDLVFPWFMWIMGVCMPISIISIRKKKIPKSKVLINILKRSVKLFLIGLFLGAGPYLNSFRILGVLQRFAIAYLVVGGIMLITMGESGDHLNFIKHFNDVWALKIQWVLMIIIIIIHTLLTFLLKPPNCPSGYLGPGGLHDGGKYKDCTGGASGYIDEIILGNHIYKYAIITEIYKSKPFDPEGILGCLTSIFQVFLGVQAGMTLCLYKSHKQRIARWLIWAVITGLIGAILCNFSKEGGWIPLNKNLWSLSFVLVTSCFAFILLSTCYVIIDIFKLWSGKPFLCAGMNSIILYIGHNMTYDNFLIHWIPNEDGYPTHFITLLDNVWGTSIWVFVGIYLYKIKYFFSV